MSFCMPGEGSYLVRRIGAAKFISNFWNIDLIPGRILFLSAFCVADLPKCTSWHVADTILCCWLFPVAQDCSAVPGLLQCTNVSRAPELCMRPVRSKDKLKCSPGQGMDTATVLRFQIILQEGRVPWSLGGG